MKHLNREQKLNESWEILQKRIKKDNLKVIKEQQ